MWNLLFYETKTENCPIADFIDELHPKLKAKALHDLDLLAELTKTLEYKQDYQARNML